MQPLITHYNSSGIQISWEKTYLWKKGKRQKLHKNILDRILSPPQILPGGVLAHWIKVGQSWPKNLLRERFWHHYIKLMWWGPDHDSEWSKGGTASLRSRTCVKRNAVFGARFKGLSFSLSLYLLYIYIKKGISYESKRAWVHIWYFEEPRKGGFSKGGFCRIRCHPQQTKSLSRAFGSAVNSALRAPQSREAYVFAKNPLQK